MSGLEETGAIDYVVVEFPRREVTGELMPGLLDLVDRRIIRIMDVLMVVTDDSGGFSTMTPDDLDPAEVGDLGSLVGASHDEVIIERESAETGVVHNHFPQAGFEVTAD